MRYRGNPRIARTPYISVLHSSFYMIPQESLHLKYFATFLKKIFCYSRITVEISLFFIAKTENTATGITIKDDMIDTITISVKF